MSTPLTDAQRRQLDDLVSQRRITRVPVDVDRAAAFLEVALDVLADVDHLRRPQNRYNLAYDAAHAVGEALLARHGYRTANGSGQHESLARFLRIVVVHPPADTAARHVDRMRRTRNQLHYEARPVSTTDAAKAIEAARTLVHWCQGDAQ